MRVRFRILAFPVRLQLSFTLAGIHQVGHRHQKSSIAVHFAGAEGRINAQLRRRL